MSFGGGRVEMDSESVAGRYAEEILEILARIRRDEQDTMAAAAKAVARTAREGGLIHVFGTGHSHMLAEELFFRAGGLACVNAVLDPPLMLHLGAASSTRVERLQGYGSILYEKQEFRPGDLLIVVSNSGVNAVPVDFAARAKEDGIPVIALISTAYIRAIHPDGAGSLLAIADIVLDNHCPPGDAVVRLGPSGAEITMGPASTIAGAFILHQVMIGAAERLQAEGLSLPIFKSANMPGAADQNRGLMERYRQRIQNFR